MASPGAGLAGLQLAATEALAGFVQGGTEALGLARELRVCSAPQRTLVTDYGDEVVEPEGRQLVAAASGGDDHECCQPVVDSTTWIAVIGGAAVVTYFLRQVVLVG
jgi:hypothetical protein